jgi:hypothetical protein
LLCLNSLPPLIEKDKKEEILNCRKKIQEEKKE